MTTTATAARALCMAVLASGFLLTVRAPAATVRQSPVPSALASLEPGRWEVSSGGGAPRAMCLMNAVALTQVRHGDAACTRMVIADDRTSATIHYACPGAGWGRTELRVETPRAVRIDTQGIAGSAPFAFTAQARRMGDCVAAQRTSSLR